MERLQARAERNDRDARFAARVAENQLRAFHFAYSVLGNAADAEEVAQEAFLRAYQKSGLLREARKFRAWINRIVFSSRSEPAARVESANSARRRVARNRKAGCDGRGTRRGRPCDAQEHVGRD